MCLEWWVFEIITFMAGCFGYKQQAAQVILFNLTFLTFTVSIGIQTCGSTLIGTMVGKGDVLEAKRYKRLVT